MFSVPSQPGENRGEHFGRIREHPHENLHKLCRGFHLAIKARRNCFIFKKEKGNIRSAFVYFNFFHETVNSHKLETANHIAQVIFVLHCTMKTHL